MPPYRTQFSFYPSCLSPVYWVSVPALVPAAAPRTPSPSSSPPTSPTLATHTQFAFPKACDRLLQQFMHQEIVGQNGQLLQPIQNPPSPFLNYGCEALITSFFAAYKLDFLLSQIMGELVTCNIKLTQWDISGDAFLSLLGRGGYVSDAFRSLGISFPELDSQDYWNERFQHDPTWNISLLITDDQEMPPSELCPILTRRTGIPFEETPYGIRGITNTGHLAPLVVDIYSNTRPSHTDPIIFSHLIHPTSRLVKYSSSDPWQTLVDVALGIVPAKTCPSLLSLVDLYTKGARPLDDGLENTLVQYFRMDMRARDVRERDVRESDVREREVGAAGAASALVKQMQGVLLPPDDAFVLALQLLVTADLTDVECARFLSALTEPLLFQELKNPILLKIHRIVTESHVPFSGIQAFLQLSGFCETSTAALSFSPTLLQRSIGLRATFSAATSTFKRTLLLPCSPLEAIKKLLVLFQDNKRTEILCPLFSELFLGAPDSPITENTLAMVLDHNQRKAFEEIAKEITSAPCDLLAILGLLLSTHTHSACPDTMLISVLTRSCCLDFSFQAQKNLLTQMQGFLQERTPLFIKRLLHDHKQPQACWPVVFGAALLEDHDPKIRLLAHPVLTHALHNGHKEVLTLAAPLISLLVDQGMTSSALQFLKSLKGKADDFERLKSPKDTAEYSIDDPIDEPICLSLEGKRDASELLNLLHQLITALWQREPAEQNAYLTDIGKFLLSLIRPKVLMPTAKVSQTAFNLIDRLLAQNEIGLASRLLLPAIELGKFNPPTRLVLRVCQAMLEDPELGALFAGFTWRYAVENKLWASSSDADLFLLHLLEQLLGNPNNNVRDAIPLAALAIDSLKHSHLSEENALRLNRQREALAKSYCHAAIAAYESGNRDKASAITASFLSFRTNPEKNDPAYEQSLYEPIVHLAKLALRMQPQQAEALLKGVKIPQAGPSTEHRELVDALIDTRFKAKKYMAATQWLPLIDESRRTYWTMRLVPPLVAMKQDPLHEPLRVALGLVQGCGIQALPHWTELFSAVRRSQNSVLQQEACALWESKKGQFEQGTEQHLSIWAEVIPMQDEEQLIQSLPSIIKHTGAAALRTVALQACVQVSKPKLKEIAPYLYGLRQNLPPNDAVDLPLMKLFLEANSGSEVDGSLKIALETFERCLPHKKDQYHLGHLVPHLIEAANRHPQLETEIFALLRSGAPMLAPHLDVSECVDELLARQSSLRLELGPFCSEKKSSTKQ